MLNFCSSRYGLVVPCLTLGFSTVFLASKPVCVRAITPEEKAKLDKLKFDVKKFVVEEKNYKFFEKDFKFILSPPVLAPKGKEDMVTKIVGDKSRVYSDENEFKKARIEYVDRIKTILAKNPMAEALFKILKDEKTGEIVDVKTNIPLLNEYARFFCRENTSSFIDLELKFQGVFKELGAEMKKPVLKKKFCDEVEKALWVLKAVHFTETDPNKNFYEESLRKLGSFFETIEKILGWDEEGFALTDRCCRLISEKSI